MSRMSEAPSTGLLLTRVPMVPIQASSPDLLRQASPPLFATGANKDGIGKSGGADRQKFTAGQYAKLASSQVTAALIFYSGTVYYLDNFEACSFEVKQCVLKFVMIATLLSSGLVSAVFVSRPRFSDTRTDYRVIEPGLEQVDFDPEASFSAEAKRQAIRQAWRFCSENP